MIDFSQGLRTEAEAKQRRETLEAIARLESKVDALLAKLEAIAAKKTKE